MLLYQPSALLRPPLGPWSAVSWTRPDQEVSGYQDLSDQFRVPYSRDKVNPDVTQVWIQYSDDSVTLYCIRRCTTPD